MNIYVTRHGESVSNINNLVCGHSDVELTDKGLKQAKQLSQKISDLQIDRVITSPLKRAFETAKVVSSENDLPLVVDERLLEFDFGDYEGLQVDDKDFLNFRNHLAHKMPNGESVLEASQRIYNLLDEVKNKNETVLLVCHNAISRVINSYFISLSNSEFYQHNLINCELKKYSFK